MQETSLFSKRNVICRAIHLRFHGWLLPTVGCRQSTEPVLVTHSGRMKDKGYMDVKRILVPLDESRLATLSLEPAYEIARRFGASVHLLMVVDDAAAAALKGIAVSEDIELERAAESTLKRASSDFADVPTEVEAIFDDDPAHAIVAYARRHPIDLVVMATHGRTGVGRWLLGSVTTKVLRSSPVPVYVIPAPKRTQIDHG